MIHELYKLSQRLEASGDLPPVGYSQMGTHLYLDLDGAGRFVQWRKDADPKGTPRFIPLGGRTGTRIEPYLLTDVLPYMFGVQGPKAWATARKKGVEDATTQAILDRKAASWLALTKRWIAKAGADPVAAAVGAFFDDPAEVTKAVEALPPGPWETQRAVIQVDGVVVMDQQSARDLWADLMDEAIVSTGIMAPCMITGEMVDVSPTHRGNAMLYGSKVGLVTSNCDSFSTYGMKGTTDIPMAPKVVRGYKRAFSYLGNHRGQHQYSLGDMTCLYWTDGGSKVTFDLFEPQPEQVRDLLKSYRTGQLQTTSPDRLHLMLFTLNTSRLVPLAWIDNSVAEFQAKVAQWFERQEFSGSPGYSLYALARPLWPGIKPIPGHATSAILLAALNSARLPAEFLTRALQRAQKPTPGQDGDNHIRNCPRNILAVLRMATNDYLKENPVASTHNPNEHRPAYLCGRLLALLELTQRAALGRVGSTVADTFYVTASINPVRALPLLVGKARSAHLPKLRKNRPGLYYTLEAQIEDTFKAFEGADIPVTLRPVEQGLFAMGFHLTLAAERDRRKALRDSGSPEIVEDDTDPVEDEIEAPTPDNDNVAYAIAAG